MLHTIELSSWEEFEKRILDQLSHESKEMRTGPNFYRGHPDSTWQLETTLERYFKTKVQVSTYYHIIKKIQSQLETFTNQKWDIPRYDDFIDRGEILTDSIIVYMQYLRHFGYPSPLLDWTYSPFVAAYFAFRDVTNNANSVAIYDFLAASELWAQGEHFPPFKLISTPPQNNKRHYLQQSVYTVCFEKIDNNKYFGSHENQVMERELFAKYIIPASERARALHSLEAYNINAYSLMGTEESLLETMFLREYKQIEITKNIHPGYDINW